MLISLACSRQISQLQIITELSESVGEISGCWKGGGKEMDVSVISDWKESKKQTEDRKVKNRLWDKTDGENRGDESNH